MSTGLPKPELEEEKNFSQRSERHPDQVPQMARGRVGQAPFPDKKIGAPATAGTLTWDALKRAAARSYGDEDYLCRGSSRTATSSEENAAQKEKAGASSRFPNAVFYGSKYTTNYRIVKTYFLDSMISTSKCLDTWSMTNLGTR